MTVQNFGHLCLGALYLEKNNTKAERFSAKNTGVQLFSAKQY